MNDTQAALLWYAVEAEALAKNMVDGAHAQAVLASVTVLALDGGRRARSALAAAAPAGTPSVDTRVREAIARIGAYSAPPHNKEDCAALMMSIWLEVEAARAALATPPSPAGTPSPAPAPAGEPVAWLQVGIHPTNEGERIPRTYKPTHYDKTWWRFDPLVIAPPAPAPTPCEDALRKENAELRAELDLRRKSGSAVDRLHNLCEGIARDADGSEWSREEWERIDAENAALRAEIKTLREPTKAMCESMPALPALRPVDLPLLKDGWSPQAIMNRQRYLAAIDGVSSAPVRGDTRGRA